MTPKLTDILPTYMLEVDIGCGVDLRLIRDVNGQSYAWLQVLDDEHEPRWMTTVAVTNALATRIEDATEYRSGRMHNPQEALILILRSILERAGATESYNGLLVDYRDGARPEAYTGDWLHDDEPYDIPAPSTASRKGMQQ